MNSSWMCRSPDNVLASVQAPVTPKYIILKFDTLPVVLVGSTSNTAFGDTT